jgi:hypothetical protein
VAALQYVPQQTYHGCIYSTQVLQGTHCQVGYDCIYFDVDRDDGLELIDSAAKCATAAFSLALNVATLVLSKSGWMYKCWVGMCQQTPTYMPVVPLMVLIRWSKMSNTPLT